MASSKVAHGKCLCGTIEIKAEGDYKASVACSCKNCQVCGGSAYTVNWAYPKDTITFPSVIAPKPTLTYPKDKATDSGKSVLRRFCGRCGSGIYSEIEDGNCFVKAPIMEGGLEPQPVAHIFTRNLPEWAQGSKTGNQVQNAP
ncbi:Mss4-like protein [Apiospora rasikravindrae]|uniref:Mss4-like protein n=1 Tax=Apiospora rasikravindrae TaxID=990691 RepID=A0ABR1SYS7_9PEZI